MADIDDKVDGYLASLHTAVSGGQLSNFKVDSIEKIPIPGADDYGAVVKVSVTPIRAIDYIILNLTF